MAESLHILLGTSACLLWLCHSGERTVARGPLVIIPHHTIVAGYYGFTLDVCVSVCPNFVKFLRSYLPETCPYFRFRTIT